MKVILEDDEAKEHFAIQQEYSHLKEAKEAAENYSTDLENALNEMSRHFYTVVKAKLAGSQYEDGEHVFSLFDFAVDTLPQETADFMEANFCRGKEAWYEDLK